MMHRTTFGRRGTVGLKVRRKGGAVRVAVIGRGFGERVVAPAFQRVDGSEVVDVVSPRDAVAVDALCRRTDVDLIAVHSPPFLHHEHVLRAVEAGHDVLCDKPLAGAPPRPPRCAMLRRRPGCCTS